MEEQKQCAAVTMNCELRMEPPQTVVPPSSGFTISRYTIQGRLKDVTRVF
jgi:hypothetical protein